MTDLLGDVRHQITKVQEYIMASGRDPEGTFDIPKFEGTVFEGGAGGKGKKGDSKEDAFFVN
jgi:xylulose-5-phosphate/fructose-6-phosphate phosphoketolase